MKDLSIVIRAEEGKIHEYIHNLEPVLLDNQCELLIINNAIDRLNIKYDHTLYKFPENCGSFKEFCFSSSKGSRVMIIDGNIGLSPEIVSELIQLLKVAKFGNIVYKIKKYLTLDKSLYYMDQKVLVYDRGVKGFNIEGQIVIEDFTLTDMAFMEINLNKLIKDKSCNELYLWYKHFILKCFPEYEQRFYELLEFEKIKIDEGDVEGIEKFFLDSVDNPIYCEYLSIRKELKNKNSLNPKILSSRIISLTSSGNENYYAWLIYWVINEKNNLSELFLTLDLNLLKSFIEYICSHISFHEYLYGLILEINCSGNPNDEGIKSSKTNLMLMKLYITMTSESAAEPKLKNKLLKVLELYLNTFMKLFKAGKNPASSAEEISDEAFVLQFQNVLGLVKQNNINKAAALLKKLSSEYPSFNRVLRYYIQGLRYKNNSFQFVISICMIVRDEEKNLNRCLSSLKPLLGTTAELIIVDTGSTDGTVDIARSYTNNVFFYKWQGSFSDARNYSISLAAGEYIILVDADEEFDKTEIQKLMDAFVTSNRSPYNTYTLKIKNYTDIGLKEYTVLTQPRIFKNDCEFYYSGKVHNQPVFKLPVKHLAATVTHYGYIMTEDIKDKKFQRTANMLKSELQENPKNIYYRFQLSTSLGMHGDLKEALKHAEIYMRMIREDNMLNEDYLMYFNNAVILYISAHRFEEAAAVCDDALKISPNFIDFIYFKALIYSETGEYERALEYTNKYLALIDNFMNYDIANDGRYSFYSLGYKNDVLKKHILCNYRLGQYNKIFNTLKSFSSPVYKDCMHAIVCSCIKTEKYFELLEFYNTCCSDIKSKFIFKYFLENYIQKADDKVQTACRSILASINYPDGFADLSDLKQALFIIQYYDIDSLNVTEARVLFNKLLPEYNSFQIEKSVDTDEIYSYKRLAQFILHRSSELARFRNYSIEKLINILKKYMALASALINRRKADLLEAREQLFLIKITEAFKYLEIGNYENTIKLLKESTDIYIDMEGLIKLILKAVIPDYKPENHAQKSMVVVADNSEEIGSYAEVVKKKLIEAANYGGSKDMLEIFRQFDNRKLYDPELFSYKTVLLMSEELYDDAGTELAEGLKRYPDDTHLLSNLCRLYSLTQDFSKSFETFCRVKILSQGKCTLKPNELFPDKLYNNASNKPRVLHGTMFGDNTINKVAAELTRKGIYAKTLNYCPKFTGYNSDYVINLNQYETGSEIISRTADTAARLIPEFDIFHFHYGSSLTFDYSDLPLLKEFGKKVIIHFWGDEFKDNGKVTKEKLQLMSGYADCCIVPDNETYERVKEFFEKIYVIRPDENEKLVDLYKSMG